MFYNAILVVIPATALAGVTGDLQKVFQACRCMLLYTLLIALQLLVFLTFIIFSSSSYSLLQFLFFPPPISLLPSSNFSSSSCFPLFPLIIAYLAVISYLDKLVQPSYLLCTQFILAFLLNYLTLLSSFCLFFLAFASLAISLSITNVSEWQLPQQVWLSHFLSFEKCLVLSFVWDWARSVLILSARPQPQTCKTIIIFKICSQDVNNNIPVLIKHDLDIVQWLDCQLLCTSRQYQSK